MNRIKILLTMGILLATGIAAQARTSSPKKVLVVYYSHTGNTRAVAENIRKTTGADLFEIVPVETYPADHKTVVDRARKEIGEGLRPALKSMVENMEQYDVIFVGSPCWWSTIAPPVATFLAASDFAGKTVVPFMTHEGSRMGRSEDEIRKLCPGATVMEGLPVRGSTAAASEQAVRQWLQGREMVRVLK